MTLVRKEHRRGTTTWHTYRLDNVHATGVTTLIGGGLPKPALPKWAARTVAEFVADASPEQIASLRSLGRNPMVDALKGVPWEARDRAGARGTEVHLLAHHLIHGHEVEVPEHLLGYVNGYVRWLDEVGAEVVLTERPVASRRWWFAGTFDAIIRIGEHTWLVDWKTSSGVYGDNALQVAAYANAEFYVDDDGVEHPLPAIDKLGVVHIRPDGTDLYEVQDPESAWKDFKHVAFVAKAKDRIAAQLVRVGAA